MTNERLRHEYTLDNIVCDLCGAPAIGLSPFVYVEGRCAAYCCDEHREVIIKNEDWVPLMKLVREAENETTI